MYSIVEAVYKCSNFFACKIAANKPFLSLVKGQDVADRDTYPFAPSNVALGRQHTVKGCAINAIQRFLSNTVSQAEDICFVVSSLLN